MLKRIIDGIDVSKCVSFDKLNGLNICCYDDTREDRIPFANFCVENKDCCYKQLKRKEQECEALQKELTELKETLANFVDVKQEMNVIFLFVKM